MPAAIPIAMIASTAIGAMASKSAANTQADAAKQAATLRQQTTNQILPVMQQNYQQGMAGLSPYANMGSSASSAIMSRMGLTPAASTGSTGSTGSMGMTGIMVQGPDGTTKQANSPEEAQFYLSKGARLMQPQGASGVTPGSNGNWGGSLPQSW